MAKKSTGTNTPATASKIFGDVQGEQFGGTSNYAKFEPGEVVHGFIHVDVEKDVELAKGNKPIDLHRAIDPRSGEKTRMPAPAIFNLNAKEANLKAGDEYSVARLPDTIKKNGSKAQGQGKAMANYALMVTKRAK